MHCPRTLRRFARARTSGRLAAAICGVVFAALGASQALAQRSPSEVAADVRARGGYGDEVRYQGDRLGENLPFPGGGSGGGADSRLDANGGGGDIQRYERGQDFESGGEADPGFNLPSLPAGLGQGIGYLLMAIAIIGLIALIVVLVMTFWPRAEKLTPTPPKTRRQKLREVEQATALPWNAGDPDELARQGKYAEAMVALLVQCLKVAGWQEEERGRTAREVLWTLAQSDARRAPLQEVLSRTERVRFAGEEATEALFEETRTYADAVVQSRVAA